MGRFFYPPSQAPENARKPPGHNGATLHFTRLQNSRGRLFFLMRNVKKHEILKKGARRRRAQGLYLIY
jgi:hypothetical protein